MGVPVAVRVVPFSLRLSDVMVVPILIWEDAALAFFSIHHYHHCLLVFLPRHTIDTLWKFNIAIEALAQSFHGYVNVYQRIVENHP